MARITGAQVRAWRQSTGWDVPETARQLRRAAGDDPHIASHESLIRQIRRWEREDSRVTERYVLLYAHALGVTPDQLSSEPPADDTSPDTGKALSHLALSRRELLADVSGVAAIAAAPRPASSSPLTTAAPPWAAAIYHAVLDPTRTARDEAASELNWELAATPEILPVLRRATAIVTAASLESDYTSLAKLLPELIGRAELTSIQAKSQQDKSDVERILSDVYAVAGWTLIKADNPVTAWVAAQRAVCAAEAAEDFLRAAAATRCLAEVHMRAGDFAEASRTALLVTAYLDAAPYVERNVKLCLRGAAMLSAAAASARRGDSHEAYAELKAAAAYADEIGRDRIELCSMFGPTNVAIHKVAIPVELGRPAEAVRNIPSREIPISPQLTERHARFLIDVARSYAQTGDGSAAEHALMRAEHIAAQEVRHHRITHQIVRSLLPQSRPNSSLRALASRCQILN